MSRNWMIVLVTLVLLFCFTLDVGAVGAVVWLVKPGVMTFYVDNNILPDQVCEVGVSSYFRGVQGYRVYVGGRVEVYTLRFERRLPIVGPLSLFDVCPKVRTAT